MPPAIEAAAALTGVATARRSTPFDEGPVEHRLVGTTPRGHLILHLLREFLRLRTDLV